MARCTGPVRSCSPPGRLPATSTCPTSSDSSAAGCRRARPVTASSSATRTSSRSVTIVHRREEFRASAIMLERAKHDPKIRWITNAAVTGVHGDTSVTGVTLTDTRSGETTELPATGLFVAIGHDPRSALFRDQVATDAEGYVLTGAQVGATASTGTSVKGVFASGDLVDQVPAGED